MKRFRPSIAPASPRPRLTMCGSDFSALYAISDIHGCASAFRAARRLIARDAQGYPGRKLVVLLGDYVDRGPASRDVLELLTQPISEGIEKVALCGNHDDQLVKMVRGELPIDAWLEFAGSATLTSFGIDVENVLKRVGLKGLHHVVRETIPTAYISRLEALPVSLQIDNLLFVHAGVRPGVALASQTDNDLMWIREPFLEDGPQLPIFVIHGHTPGITVNIGNARLGIDTAAVATGKLTVLRIVGTKFSTIQASN
ncbi:serine/threonine protein phosphatase [Agrobacterium tumefaciens]|nr:serine/threonine protein phosphatase [Agrobacterium tumefaciens]